VPGAEGISEQLGKAIVLTPLFWLVGPVERVIAILCHASSRALILLGTARQRLIRGKSSRPKESDSSRGDRDLVGGPDHGMNWLLSGVVGFR
jgi:hypothetical protein